MFNRKLIRSSIPNTWKRDQSKGSNIYQVPVHEIGEMASDQESKGNKKKTLVKNILKEGFNGQSKWATNYYRRKDLIDDVRKNGVTKPVLITRDPKNNFALGDGHHRYIAAREAGITHIPAFFATTNEVHPWEKD